MKKTIQNKYITCKESEAQFEYYRLNIYGEITKIPLKIQRKKATHDNQMLEGLKINFKIEKTEVDDYYGFVLDKDNLYMLDNLLVTHNCGKSYLAKYIAQQLGMPIIKKRASDLMDKWVGQTEQNIKEAFQEATKSKAILLLDESDSFLYDRTYSQREFEVAQVNELLTQMEDFEYPLIMTTNLKDRIDKASMRRFIFKIKFDYMKSENIVAGVKEYFGEEFNLTEEQLNELPHLCAGDFALIKKKMEILENTCTNELIYQYLLKEQKEKDIKESSTIVL